MLKDPNFRNNFAPFLAYRFFHNVHPSSYSINDLKNIYINSSCLDSPHSKAGSLEYLMCVTSSLTHPLIHSKHFLWKKYLYKALCISVIYKSQFLYTIIKI